METMFLFAGLAVAGLAGIAAAFYFSIRSGNRGGKRLRPGGAEHAGAEHAGAGHAGAGHAGTGKRPGSRSSAAGHGRTGRDRPTSYGSKPGGTSRADDASRRNYRDADDTGPDLVPEFGDPALAGLSREAHFDVDPARPRRRMGFRKGADLDEELWPTETFGGVSDEQFWDDLAADKPLTTTARTAQQGPATRKRPVGARPATGLQAPRAGGDTRRGGGSGANPESRTGPNPAPERTMLQPAYAATQPVPSMTPQVRGDAAQVPGLTQPTETRGRRRASSAEEDPLTSAAFALRASGPVDGRSALRSGGSHARGSYGGPSSVTKSMPTPPYGENYGYGSRGAVSPGDDRNRPNGTRNHARHAATSEGTRPTRHVYPQDSSAARNRQGTNGNPGTGYQASRYRASGYPGSSYPGNGQRAPYDPREDHRRLTHQR
jgi:hypothetical protein